MEKKLVRIEVRFNFGNGNEVYVDLNTSDMLSHKEACLQALQGLTTDKVRIIFSPETFNVRVRYVFDDYKDTDCTVLSNIDIYGA